MNFALRHAATEERSRIRAFLPRWPIHPADQCLVAEASDPSRIVGLGTLALSRSEDGSNCAQIDAAVVPRFRESEILGAVAKSLLELASRLGSGEVRLFSAHSPGSLEYDQFRQLGFCEYRTVISYQFSVAACAVRTRLVYDRLVRRRGAPAEAKVVGLSPQYWPDVVQLARSEGLMKKRIEDQVMRVGLGAYYSPASRILLVGEKVKGALLAHTSGRAGKISILVVSPSLRGGFSWANALLSYHAAEVGLSLGYQIFTVDADPQRHTMTTHLARRMKATAQAQKVLFKINLGEIASKQASINPNSKVS